MFDVGGMSGVFGGKVLSRGDVTDASEVVPESLITSGGFSALENIAGRQADARVVASYGDAEGENMVKVPTAQELLGQKGESSEKSRYYPSQSARSLLMYAFKLNHPTQLNAYHPTRSFSVDQIIPFARAVGLEVSLAS